MITPLAAIPPAEPATAPPPDRGEGFAGALATAIARRAPRDRASSSTGAADTPATAARAEPSDDLDADATTTGEADAIDEPEPADAADALAGAGAVGSTASVVVGRLVAGTSEVANPDADPADAVARPAAPITARADEGAPLLWPTDAAATAQVGGIDTTSTAGDIQIDAGDADGRSAGTTNRADARTVFGPADAATADDAGDAAGGPAGPPSPARPLAADGTAVATEPAGERGSGPPVIRGPRPSAGDGRTTARDAPPPIPADTDDGRSTTRDTPSAAAPPVTPDVSIPTIAVGAAPGPTTAGTSHMSGPVPATHPTGSAAATASDTIRFLRELGPARAVQRLAVDLDGAMVAVRVDQTGATPVRVQIVDDPAGRLDRSWVTSVERTLSHTMQHDGSGAHNGQRRREPRPHPDDTAPTATTGRRWADALGADT